MMRHYEIEDILSKFTFVRWDRFVDTDEGLKFYGWIDREKDSYKDFILLTFYKNDHIGWTTSSVEKTKDIRAVFGLAGEEQNTCKRVEAFYDIKNSIKL